MDLPNPMGLPVELQDLVIFCFAALTNRHFTLNGGPCTVEIGKLGDNTILAEQQLPSETDWQEAHRRASQLFGLVSPKVLNAANVGHLVQEVRKAVSDRRTRMRNLLEHLQGRAAEYSVSPSAARLRTASSANLCLVSLTQAEDDRLVNVLANLALETSEAAVAKVLGSLDALLLVMHQAQWGVFRSLAGISDQRTSAARTVLDQLGEALAHDEHVQPLKEVLTRLESKALEVLSSAIPPGGREPPRPDPPSGGTQDLPPPIPDRPGAPSLVTVEEDVRSALSPADARKVLDDLRTKLEADGEMELTLSWRLQRRKPG
jgi:hypothetical protein